MTELPITTDHQCRWSLITKQTFQAMQEMGFDPPPMLTIMALAKRIARLIAEKLS